MVLGNPVLSGLVTAGGHDAAECVFLPVHGGAHQRIQAIGGARCPVVLDVSSQRCQLPAYAVRGRDMVESISRRRSHVDPCLVRSAASARSPPMCWPNQDLPPAWQPWSDTLTE